MSESLYYEKRGPEGSQDWIVLLHPTPVDHCFWLPASSSFEDRYRVLIPDLPGHGQSALDGEASMRSMASAVLALLDRQGIERAAFCGCSIGGYLLYELWRQAPQRMRALAIASAKPHADSEEGRRVRAGNIASLEAQGTNEFFDRMLQSLVGQPARRDQPHLLERLRTMMNRITPAAAIAIQRALAARPDSRPTAKTITVPTAVLAGALDTVSTPAELRELADLVPQSAYFLLQEMGHYAPYEQPRLVGALLRRFLDDHL